MYDSLPWQVAVPLIIVLWAMWLWMHYEGKRRIQVYFERRRHLRRLRQYARHDIKMTQQIYATIHGRPNKKRVTFIESRRNR